jgi:hypothetical protein
VYVYIAVKIGRYGPSLNVRFWHLADPKREAGHVGFRVQSRHDESPCQCQLLTQSSQSSEWLRAMHLVFLAKSTYV